jgi:5-methylcytosine-specific restriction endonuclease McrA
MVHHVRAVADGGRDELANLVALCADCHGHRHR